MQERQEPVRQVVLNPENSVALDLVGRINKLYPRQESSQFPTANFRGGLLQLDHLAFHECPAQAKLADHQRGRVSFRAHPCCPGDIKGIFPDVVDSN